MIQSLRIRNFRNHKDTTLHFDRLTVIAGPNGAGKSNALAALLDLNESINTGAQSPIDSEKLDLEFSLKDSEGQDRDYRISREKGDEDIVCNQGLHKIDLRSEAPEVDNYFGAWCYLKPDLTQLSPCYSESVNPQLQPSGRQLASTIATMMTSDFSRFEALKAAFQEVVPQVIDIRTTREKINLVRNKSVQIDGREVNYQDSDEVIGDSLLFDTKTQKGLPASSMNDGTLMVLTLITAIFQNPQPRLIIIDDFESGLFGETQFALVLIFRKLLKEFPGLQIILTTRSPFVVNAACAHEVNILCTDNNANALSKLLSEHPKIEGGEESMSIGELWLLDWPAWVLE